MLTFERFWGGGVVWLTYQLVTLEIAGSSPVHPVFSFHKAKNLLPFGMKVFCFVEKMVGAGLEPAAC